MWVGALGFSEPFAVIEASRSQGLTCKIARSDSEPSAADLFQPVILPRQPDLPEQKCYQKG